MYICPSIANKEKPVLYQHCRWPQHAALHPGPAAGRERTASHRTPHDKAENQQGVNYEDHRTLAAQLRRRPRSAAAGSSCAGADESVAERTGSDFCHSQCQCRSVRDRERVGAELGERLRRRHRVLPDDGGLVRDHRDLPGLHGNAIVDRVDRAAAGLARLRDADDEHELDLRSATEPRNAAHGRSALSHDQ